jgi:hypothetical protein
VAADSEVKEVQQAETQKLVTLTVLAGYRWRLAVQMVNKKAHGNSVAENAAALR